MDSGDTALTIAFLGDLKLSHVSLYATVCTIFVLFCFGKLLSHLTGRNRVLKFSLCFATLAVPFSLLHLRYPFLPQGCPQFP